MMTRRPPPILVLGDLLLVVLLALAACSSPLPTKIKQVLDDPRRFDGKIVTISGKVTQAYNVLVAKGFVVRDETGEIPVITDRSVPAIGAKIKVRGRVSQALSLPGLNLVVLEEISPGGKAGNPG